MMTPGTWHVPFGNTLKYKSFVGPESDSRAYPIVRLQCLVKRRRIKGVAAGAPIEITYTVVLRAEFVPAGADIDDDEFEQRETGRPPGFCAQTILRFGGLDVMALLDGGATCSALPEEVVLATIGYDLKQIEANRYSADSRPRSQYPRLS